MEVVNVFLGSFDEAKLSALKEKENLQINVFHELRALKFSLKYFKSSSINKENSTLG